MKLILGKEVVAKFKQGGTADITTAYFSTLVTRGVIPYHVQTGKKRKMFIYEEAKNAFLENQDPSRDAQREAVTLAKEEKKLLADDTKREDTKSEMIKINDHYQKVVKQHDKLSLLSKEEYMKLLESSGGYENIEEGYLEEQENITINGAIIDLLWGYIEDMQKEKPRTMNELDLIIKRNLIYSMLDETWFEVDTENTKELA